MTQVAKLALEDGAVYTGQSFGAEGEVDGEEGPEVAARREFAEELGIEASGPLQSLGQVRQRAGKIVWGYALEGDLNVTSIRCNEVSMEWPPRSGRNKRTEPQAPSIPRSRAARPTFRRIGK